MYRMRGVVSESRFDIFVVLLLPCGDVSLGLSRLRGAPSGARTFSGKALPDLGSRGQPMSI